MPAWGPWVSGLDQAERTARLRALRALARVLGGPVAAGLVEALRAAECDPDALQTAAAALDRLPTVPMRRILCTYAALDAPPRRRREAA